MATFLFNTKKYIMKKTLALVCVISLVFSACKKDDDNTPIDSTPIGIVGCTDPNACNFNASATTDDGSCLTVYGCIDPTQFNYDPNAQCDDGSCLTAFEIAQGVWNIAPDCEEIDILGQVISLNDQMPETVNVQANGESSLYIDMNGSQVEGDIDNEGNILVNQQTISIDFSGFPIPVQVSGTGKIESEQSGYMDLTYSGEIDFIPNMPIPLPFSATCHLVLTK